MRWVVTVVAALVLLWTTSANAQAIPSPPVGKPTAAEEATAKRNFETGLKLFGEGAFAEALVAFEQSYRVAGRPSALRNIAQCHRNLKHFVEAYEAYEQMLAKHDAQIAAADKKTVQQALDELGVLTGTVTVDVNEADAEIEIDGKSVGRSPMTKPKRVAATGGHTVRVTKPTFARFEQTFTVDSQQNKKIEVKLELEKTTGRVVVREQSGRDAHVFIDGEDKGPAPWEGDVAAGEHTIQAKSARFASEPRKITVAAKERVDVALDAAPVQGRLRVTTVPASATIVVDGKTMGTGVWEGELAEGSHRIEVSLDGQTPQVREITLGRGQLVVQEIPIVSTIAFKSATVYPGFYVRFALFGHISPDGHPDEHVEPFTRNDGTLVAQAGAALRIGRMWDWWGFEIVGVSGFEHRHRDYAYDVRSSSGSGFEKRRFTDVANGAAVFIGIGPRVTSKDDTVRFTFGIAPGVAFHGWGDPRRESNNDGSNNNPTPDTGNRFVQIGNTGAQGSTGSNETQKFAEAGYTTFGVVMDGGILLGATPGIKFFLGLQAWLDFAPTIVVGPDTTTPIPNEAFKQPGRGITLVQGTQFFVGPTLGLQFGH
jgi:hypothetical protein